MTCWSSSSICIFLLFLTICSLVSSSSVVIDLDDSDEDLAVNPSRFSKASPRPQVPRAQKPSKIETFGYTQIDLEEGGKIPESINSLVYQVVRQMHRTLFSEWGSSRLSAELNSARKAKYTVSDWLIPLRIINALQQDIVVLNTIKYKLTFDVVNPMYLSSANLDKIFEELGQERAQKLFSEWYSLTEGASQTKLDNMSVPKKMQMMVGMLQAVDPKKWHALLESEGAIPGEKVERWESNVIVKTGAEPSWEVLSSTFLEDFEISDVLKEIQVNKDGLIKE